MVTPCGTLTLVIVKDTHIYNAVKVTICQVLGEFSGYFRELRHERLE